MKYILLSADNNPSVYLVPNEVADNLDSYCIEFCNHWLHESPNAEEYHIAANGFSSLCYNEKDFIKYLNKWIFPDHPSKFVEELEGVCDDEEVPEKYKDCPWFNF